jgi:MYXO-CTERM domain-containing protein
VTPRSETQVAVTFSVDMDPAATAVPGAYQLTPAAQVRDVALEGARTVVLTTSTLRAGSDYQLSVTGVRSAAGGTLAGTAKASFQTPAQSPAPEDPPPANPTPSDPAPADPSTPAPAPAPSTPEPTAPEAQPTPEEPVAAQPPMGGCSAVAGGSWVWGSVAVAALAARRRRRSRPSA